MIINKEEHTNKIRELLKACSPANQFAGIEAIKDFCTSNPEQYTELLWHHYLESDDLDEGVLAAR
jgi:hypothetical protein